MTTELSVRNSIRLQWTFQNDEGLAISKESTELAIANTIADGTGENCANQMWRDRRELTAASPTDLLDLSGSLTNQWGQTVTFSKIKAILIYNKGLDNGNDTFTEAAGEDLLIGGAGSGGNAWAAFLNTNQDAEVTLRSGGAMLLTAPVDGYTVTAGSGDILKVLHDGTDDITYDIVIIGEQA